MIMEGTLHPLGTVLRLWYRITEISEVWEGRDVCLLSPRWLLSADIGWRASNNVGPDVSEPPPGPCLSRSWHSGKPGQWSWRSELCHPQDLKGRCGRGVLEWVDPSCEERAMEKGGLREWGWVSAHFPRVQTCTPVLSLFSDVWLFNPVDCSPPDSSVHGDSSGKNTGVGCDALLQGIFLTQVSNLCLLHLPALSAGFFTTSATWEAHPCVYRGPKKPDSNTKLL